MSIAAKRGLIGRTNLAAQELAKDKITANLIFPGWVPTSLVQNQIDGHGRDENKTVGAIMHELLAEKRPTVRLATLKASSRLGVPR
jgi:NAD(P)-dependent dehydrogenase (short-subunit alcohol dehydrogenase family)